MRVRAFNSFPLSLFMMAIADYRQLLSPWNMAIVTKEPVFKIIFNFKSYVATSLDHTNYTTHLNYFGT